MEPFIGQYHHPCSERRVLRCKSALAAPLRMSCFAVHRQEGAGYSLVLVARNPAGYSLGWSMAAGLAEDG